MNDKDNAVYQALGRVERFGTTHAATFPAGSIAAGEFARVSQLIAEIGPEDSNPGVPASPATGARNHLFAEVWEDLKAIAATARTIARKEPGFAAAFTLWEETHRNILATAEDFLKNLQDPATVAKFVDYLLPADFVTDLQADLAAINHKGDEQTDDKLEDVGDTARTALLIKEGRGLIGSLNTSVRNRFRRDNEVLAEWRSASRIHRTARPAAENIPPPAPPVA